MHFESHFELLSDLFTDHQLSVKHRHSPHRDWLWHSPKSGLVVGVFFLSTLIGHDFFLGFGAWHFARALITLKDAHHESLTLAVLAAAAGQSNQIPGRFLDLSKLCSSGQLPATSLVASNVLLCAHTLCVEVWGAPGE